MDPVRFDRLAKTLSATGTRRTALVALLSGSLALLGRSQPAQGRKRRGGGGVTIEGPCGDGSGTDNRCKRPEQCCTGICERTQRDKGKRCRCRRNGQPCTETINCCQGAGQDLVCVGATCQPRCTSDSCTTGCCDGTTCQEGNTTAACGNDGTACDTCAVGQTCRTNRTCGGCGDFDPCPAGCGCSAAFGCLDNDDVPNHCTNPSCDDSNPCAEGYVCRFTSCGSSELEDHCQKLCTA